MDAANYESITIGANAVGFTTSILGGFPPPSAAFVTVEDAEIRFRIDGSDPTSAEGHLLQDEDSITVTGMNDLSNFRAIRSGSSNATVRVTYMAM